MASYNEVSASLGGWEGGDFTTTVTQYRGVGADTDLPDENRFVTGVVQLLQRRAAELERQGEFDEIDIAIFVLKPSPPDSVLTAERKPMIDNGLTRVIGRLWFTAAPVVSAYYVDLPEDTDDGRFSYVTDNLDLGAQPTLLFDPRPASPQLRWYPRGLGQPDNVKFIPLVGGVSRVDVFDAIEQVYKQCFITPSGLPRGVSLWEDAREYRPLKDAEALVQSHLKAGLAMRFPYCTVRHEQAQLAGRTDLEIEQSDPINRNAVTRHAIIELKVLRSYWSSGSTVSGTFTKKQIKEGVRQAAAYRMEKGVQWSALCCFDMRKGDDGDDSCFAQVQECAQVLDVALGRWFLYASSAELRDAMTGQSTNCC